jgi:hypothetical protein
MVILCEVECIFYDGHSLKEKRSLLKSVIINLQKNLNVAVAELDYQDLWQRTKLGIVTISTDKVHAEKVIQQALKLLDAYSELERTTTHVERL